MDIQQMLNLKKEEIDKIIQIQDSLCDISIENIESIKDLITNYFLSSKNSVRQLLYSIKFAIEWRPVNFQLYCELLEFSSKEIGLYFTSDELCVEILTNDFIRLRLYDIGLISLSSIQKIANTSITAPIIFQPELQNNKPDEEFNRLRHEGINEDALLKVIRFDDIDIFQEYASNNNIDFNLVLKPSIFENNTIINDFLRMPNLIEYAAFFASIKIFKFLWMNGATLSPRLPEFAAAGGCYEIIHYLEDKSFSFEKAMYYALRFHRNEISSYLNETHNIPYNTVSFQTCVLYYNVDKLVHLLGLVSSSDLEFDINTQDHGMSIFMFAAENGYLDIVEWLSLIKDININVENEIGVLFLIFFFFFFFFLQWTALRLAAENGHLDIVKYLVNLKNINVNIKDYNKETIIHYALQTKNNEMVEIILSNPNLNPELRMLAKL